MNMIPAFCKLHLNIKLLHKYIIMNSDTYMAKFASCLSSIHLLCLPM